MSMSKTAGATCCPVANEVPVMAVLMKPVAGYRHWPAGLTEPCSWYCQRETSGGCQHEPAEVLHGTGAGSATAAGVADRVMSWAGPAHAGAAATAEVTSTAPMSNPSARAPRILRPPQPASTSRAGAPTVAGSRGSRPTLNLSGSYDHRRNGTRSMQVAIRRPGPHHRRQLLADPHAH